MYANEKKMNVTIIVHSGIVTTLDLNF